MIEEIEVQRAANQYQSEGYAVSINPPEIELPSFLAGHQPDILAEKDHEKVVVFVKTRDELSEKSGLGYTADIVNSQPGWRFDLVVVPDETWPDKIIQQVAELTAHETLNLATQVRELHSAGHIEAAILLGWSAVESALRHQAAQASIPLERKDPHFVISILYSEGDLSYSDYEHLLNWQRVRNTLAHGLKPARLNARLPLTMAIFIERLLKVDRAVTNGNLSSEIAPLPDASEAAVAVS